MSKLIRPNRIAAGAALAALTLACAAQAIAQGPGDPLAIPPPTSYVLPGATLRVTPSQVSAGDDARITFRVIQTGRRIARGTMALTLPSPWLQRAASGGLAYATVPVSGTGSSSRVRVRRVGRVVRFSFTNGRRNDTGTYIVTDHSLPPATYRASFALRNGGYTAGTGSLSVVVLPVPVPVPVP